MARILVVDDDEDIVTLIKNILSVDHHMVDTVTDPLKLKQVTLSDYQLILLDIMMPGEDGYSICSRIRDQVDCPIIFLSAKSLQSDIVKGLAIGADDYLMKPFGVEELRMRIHAHLRREKREHVHTLDFDQIHINLSGKEILVGDHVLPLTKGEYAICELLAMNRGQVFSREKIYEKVFGYDAEGSSDTIMEHIKNIRSKFSAKELSPIETVWGIGYKWK